LCRGDQRRDGEGLADAEDAGRRGARARDEPRHRGGGVAVGGDYGAGAAERRAAAQARTADAPGGVVLAGGGAAAAARQPARGAPDSSVRSEPVNAGGGSGPWPVTSCPLPVARYPLPVTRHPSPVPVARAEPVCRL